MRRKPPLYLQHPDLFSEDEIRDMLTAKRRQALRVTTLPGDPAQGKGKKMAKVNKKVRDMYGNYIQPGDYISYPARQGKDMYVRTGRVLEVDRRQLNEKPAEDTLRLAVAYPPRWDIRKYLPADQWDVKIRKITIGRNSINRSTVLPKSYVQNDSRYNRLLEI
jgi:hypothetical protein